MLNSKDFRIDLVYTKSIDPYALSSSLFTQDTRPRIYGLNRSDATYGSQVFSDVNELPDYTKLINDNYPQKAYTNFLNIIINTPNIIIEERSTRKIADEVRAHPRKRYSMPNTFKKQVSEATLIDFDMESKNDEAIDSVTNFSLKIDNENDQIVLNRQIKAEDPFFLTIDPNDPDLLTEDQIKKVIEAKMRHLDQFNKVLELREEISIIRHYNISPQTLRVLRNFQLKVRSSIMRRKFFDVLRMNAYIEQKRTYLSLKRCIEHFDRCHKNQRHDKHHRYYLKATGKD